MFCCLKRFENKCLKSCCLHVLPANTQAYSPTHLPRLWKRGGQQDSEEITSEQYFCHLGSLSREHGLFMMSCHHYCPGPPGPHVWSRSARPAHGQSLHFHRIRKREKGQNKEENRSAAFSASINTAQPKPGLQLSGVGRYVRWSCFYRASQVAS